MDWFFKGSTPRGESLQALGRSQSTESLASAENLAAASGSSLNQIPNVSETRMMPTINHCCPLATASASGLVPLDKFASQLGNEETAFKVAGAHSAFWASLGTTSEEKDAVLNDGAMSEESLHLLMEYVALFNEALGELKAPYQEKELIYLFFKKPNTIRPRSRTTSTSNLREEAVKKVAETTSERPPLKGDLAEPFTMKAGTPTRQFADMFFSSKSTQLANTPTSTKIPPRLSMAPIGTLASAPFDGHPHEVVLGAIKGFRVILSEVVSALSETSDGSEFALDAKTKDRAFLLLKHLEILSRYDGNRDALSAHAVLDSVVTILDLAAAALIRLDDKWDKDSSLDDGVSSRMVDLKNMIISSMAILARTVDPESKWRKWVSSGGSEKFRTPSATANGRKPRLDSKFFHRVADIITTILLYFSESSSEPSLVSFSIRIGALSTLGSLLIARPSTVRRHLLKSEGLKRLSEFLRYPSYISKDSLEAISAVTYRSEFRAQVLLWNVLHLLTRISGTCLRRLEESNGFRGISSLFRWVALVGEHFQSEAEDFYPEFLLPMEDEKDPTFTSWAKDTKGDANSNSHKRKEIRTLYNLAIGVCTNTGNPIEPDSTDAFASPITGKFPKTHKAFLPDKEYSGEQSSHMERMLRILVSAFSESPEVASPLHVMWTENEFDLRPLKIAFLRFLRTLMRLNDVENSASEVDFRDSLFVRRGLCIGWMESLGVWKMLIGPLFYDHPTPFKYLRDDVLDIFVLASALPELPNVGAISTLITVVSAKARKDNGDLWATEDRLAACTALKQIVTSASEVSVNSLRRAGCLDVFFPIAFDEKEATEGAELELRELCLDLLTSLTKAGPETAIFIAADKGFRQNLLKSYTEHLGTNSFEKVRFLLYHVTMQLLSLPGSGIPTSKNEEYMAPLSIDTKAPKNQLSTEWMSNVLGLFPSAIDSRRSLDLQNNLLNLLRELMRSSPPGSVNRRRIRHALISGRVFEHLLSILSVSITPWEGMTEAEAEVAYHDLCSIVFSTIGIVITGSDFARKTFRDLQGYDEIRARILKKGHHSGWSGLLESFFGLLVPRWMPASPTQPSNIPVVIRNPDVLHALVALFAEVAHDIQLDLLEKLEFLAKGHEMNRVIMSQVGLGMLLLKKVLPHCKTEELVAKCINVFETIANYSITVAEAKALLRLLRHIDPSSEKTTSAGPVSQSEPQQLSRASSSSSLQTPRMSRRASGSLLERKHMGGSQNYLPPFYDSLLKCVRKLSQRKEADLDFFYFSGKNSGIVLPKVERWPSSSGGYSFFTWIKIEEGIDLEFYASRGSGQGENPMVIFSMRDESGFGVELEMRERQLHLTIYKGDKTFKLSSEYKLALRRWHFVAICQTAPKFPWFGASEASIYVNGHLRAQGKLEYPETLEYTVNRIGATGWVSQPDYETKPVSALLVEADTIADVEEAINTPEIGASTICLSSFCGQMASIYLVDECLSATQLGCLFELGSNHSSQFRLEDAISYPDMEKTLFDGTLHHKIFLHLYPTAIKARWAKAFCFDVSSKRNAKAEMVNVISCSTRCLRSAIHALGGIEILLPLVTHLDYPLEPLDNNFNSGSLIDASNAVRVERLSTFLRILGVLIGDDSGHCDRLAVIKGPKIIGMLLQQQNSCCLNMNTLDTMMALSKVALGASGPLSFAGELAADIQESLILDFRLWSMAATKTQLEFLEFLGHYLPTQLERLRSRHGLIYILDVLETFYWNVPPDHLPPDLLARLILNRPEASHIAEMRTEMFKIASNLLPTGILQEELSRILASLWMRRTDPIHVYDLLLFLMKKIIYGPATAVLECLLAQGTITEMCFWLLSECSDEHVRKIVLNLMLLIIKLERTPDKYRKKLRLEEFPGNMFAPSPTLNFGQIGISFSSFNSKYILTRSIYLSMLQLCIEEQILDWFSDIVIQSVDSSPHFRFRNIAYLSCLIDLIHRTLGGNPHGPSLDTIELGLEIIKDITTLVKVSINAENLRRVYGWQTLLVQSLFLDNASGSLPSLVPKSPLVPEKPETFSPVEEVPEELESPNSGAAEVKSPTLDTALPDLINDYNDAVLKLIAAVIYDAFESDKKAWRLVEETTVVIWLSKRLGERENGIKFNRRLLFFVLKEVRREIGLGHAGVFSSVKTENIWHLLLLTEELMFNHQDMKDSLLSDIKAMATSTPSDLVKVGDQDTNSLFYEIGKNRLPPRIQSLSRRDSDDIIVRISYPFEECREVVEECLEILSSFVEYGITHINLSENEKSHSRIGGLLRLELRILLSALSIPDNNTWLVVMPFLTPLLDKHAQSYADTQSRQRILHIIGAIHNAFTLALNCKHDPEHPNLDYHIILPLYMLIISRWQDYVVTLKTVEGNSLVKEETLSDSTTSDTAFINLVTSANWEYIYDHHLFSALKQVEQEEFSFVPLASKRYVKVVRTTYLRWRKEEIAAQKAYEVAHVHVKAIASRKINEETSRVSERISNHEIERRSIMRQWLNNYRALTEERAIWAPLRFDRNEQKWKLDRMENFLRMRPRLTQNYEFDDHRDAAARRDKVHLPGLDMNPMSLQSSPRVERAMMGQTAAAALATAAADRRKAQVEKLRMHFESGSTNDLMREVSEGALGSRVTEEDLEDEWNVVAEDDQNSQNTGNSLSSLVGNMGANAEDLERFVCGADCELILLMTAVKGRLELYNTHLSFRADLRKTAADLNEADQRILALLAESEVLIRERRWPLNNLREVYLRRYMLRNSALEFFFMDRTNHLFNFRQAKDRIKFMTKISQLRPQNLVNAEIRSPPEIAKRSDYTERWQRHEISNFEYLMYLNTVSGRTYSDLTQYPVFPWILADYTTKTIDLNDPKTYRDLSKPIGALNETRLEQLLERFRQFEDPSGIVKKFLYGTHYSTSAAVLFYLIRLEPFASLHIALQAGKFDHPDRQFHSVDGCWKSVFTGNGDVKELIPEFFYMPEFLLNENNFDLGRKQTGAVVDDVTLPEWASTPEEFIRIHREALEGDYVSEHLHEWIDLIWGYKQTGEEAVKANNVFYYLTYEGAINIDSIKDPVERKSIEDQINNFGQTPSQLFTKPHPQRLKRDGLGKPSIFTTPHNHKSFLISLKGTSVQYVACSRSQVSPEKLATGDVGAGAVQFPPFLSQIVGNEKQIVVTADTSLTVGLHRWFETNAAEQTYQFDMDPGVFPKRTILSQFALNINLRPGLFAVSRDCKYMFSAGHWDSSFHVSSIDVVGAPPRSIDIVYGHHDIVTCLTVSEDGRTLVTGSRDTTAMAWELLTGVGEGIIVRQDNRRIFYGHDDEVTTVAANVEHDLLVSGSKDGSCIFHALHEPRYIRTIRPSSQHKIETMSVQLVKISSQAAIIVYSEEVNSASISLSTDAGGDLDDTDASSQSLVPMAKGAAAGGATGISTTGVSFIHVYTINGKQSKSRMFTWKFHDIAVASDGMHMIAADNRNGLLIMKVDSLQTIHRFDVEVPVLTVAISENKHFIFMGQADGKLLLLALDKKASQSLTP